MGFHNRRVKLTSPLDVERPLELMNPSPPTVHLPPLLALATIQVEIRSDLLSARLADILSSIHSAPDLSSIIFKYPKSTTVKDVPTSRTWIDVDKWLARLAMSVKTRRSLTVVLTTWPEGNSRWEEYLPEFMKAGGELRVEAGARS